MSLIMMKKKCVITGKETLDKTKNYPLSKEARKLLPIVRNKYHSLLVEETKKELLESGDFNEVMIEEVAQTISNKLSIKATLALIEEGGEKIKKIIEELDDEIL